MRGKVLIQLLGYLVQRITPAYAGKRFQPDRLQVCRRDHPRLCGEKYRVGQIFQLALGSPPPMRGKVVDSVGQPIARRITPAYAGKS